jgi:hypothetical protein
MDERNSQEIRDFLNGVMIIHYDMKTSGELENILKEEEKEILG